MILICLEDMAKKLLQGINELNKVEVHKMHTAMEMEFGTMHEAASWDICTTHYGA